MPLEKSLNKDSHHALIKSTSIISLGTLASRILGFFRDIILARFLGTAAGADAFFVAFRIPNLFRDLVGEGAVNSSIVPVLSEYVHQREKHDTWHFISVMFSVSLVVLSAITLIGIVFSPLIVRFLAPGFIADHEKLVLTIRLTRIMFPYLVFIGLAAYTLGVLYTFRSFWVPAFSPCLLNVAVIIAALIAFHGMDEPIYGLAIGVLAGGILQLAVQLGPLMKNGMHLKDMRSFSHPGARKVGKLLVPRLVGSGVYQLNIFIDTLFASLSSIVGEGGISAIYYATRIVQFPMGVFGLSMASAVLPAMSGLAARNHIEDFKRTLIFSIKNISLVMFPFSMLLVVLARPVIRILFERGAFDAYSTDITSWALLCSAFGLLSFGGVKMLAAGFHSLQDTKTPVKVAGICLLVNIVFSVVLMGPLKVGGIALASSISSTVNFGLLFYFMEKKIGRLHAGLTEYFLKIALASLTMGVATVWLWRGLIIDQAFLKLMIVGVTGLIVFIVMAFLLKIEQALLLRKWILKTK